MKKKTKNKIAGMVISVFILGILILLDNFGYINLETYIENENTKSVTEQDNIQNIDNLYKVVRVVDGDTIVIDYNGTGEKVRLIGIDTPESVHPDADKNTKWGNTASDYTKYMLSGKYVGVEFDVEQTDKYGRLLAYVYLDGKMYNKTLLENGFAKVSTYPPNVKYVDEFVQLQKQARENKIGIWKD